MGTQILVICDRDRFSAQVQAIGERLIGRVAHPAYPYHVAWCKDGRLFDQSWQWREAPPDSWQSRDVRAFVSPVDLSIDYLTLWKR